MQNDIKQMTKIDPIIAVKDVSASADWYESVFDCKRNHGGSDFAVILSADNEVLICLHAWGKDDHPTMENPEITPGNGLLLYFKTDDLDSIRRNVQKIGYPVEEDIHLNPNSTKMEFSLRDPDGYYITVTEYHKYKG